MEFIGVLMLITISCFLALLVLSLLSMLFCYFIVNLFKKKGCDKNEKV